MKTKENLIWLLFSMCLAAISFQSVHGQKEIAAIAFSDSQRSYTSSRLLLSSFDYNSYKQDSNKNLKTKEFYLQRSENQRTAGWIFLGVGTAMVVIGGIGFGSNFEINIFSPNDPVKDRRADTFGFVMLAGIVADLISIPFFISAHNNKKMASTLSFSNQTLYIPQNRSYCQNAVPSMTLRINF